jgi:para-aminobenzoate synthetase component 1
MKKWHKNMIDQITEYYDESEYVLLESQMPEHPSSQVSYVAVQPKRIIFGKGRHITNIVEGIETNSDQNPWTAIKEFMDESLSMTFGFLGYDLKNHIDPLGSQNPELIDVPDFYFMEPRIILKIEGEAIEVLSGDVNLQEIKNQPVSAGTESVKNIKRLEEKASYIRKINEIQRLIREGDFYELNYSYPIQAETAGNALSIYKKMREINPVPFGAFLKTEDFHVCCASPERFLKKSGRKVISEPIKGTSPRSDEKVADLKYREELLNEKNKAENLMIVDLVRHDLSLIAETGSVQVSKLFDVQSFGTVHQLISTIEATALKDVHPVDVIKACFPMGSMTGAPKIEVMKTIEDLEIYRRGIYSGAIGYFTPEGDFDFNVVIRSAIVKDGRVIYPVGGAITGDSNPEEEWEETHVKARVLTRIAEK